MRYSYLRDPIRVYFRFLILIFIVLGYLSCSSSLVGNCGAIILY